MTGSTKPHGYTMWTFAVCVGITLVLNCQTGVRGTFNRMSTLGSVPGRNGYAKVVVYRKTSSWSEAMETCRRDNSALLCYTESRHVSHVAAELTFLGFPKMWIRNRNCSQLISEPNLSIHLKDLNFSRAQTTFVSKHKFEKEEDTQKQPFICFVNVSSRAVPSPLVYTPSGQLSRSNSPHPYTLNDGNSEEESGGKSSLKNFPSTSGYITDRVHLDRNSKVSSEIQTPRVPGTNAGGGSKSSPYTQNEQKIPSEVQTPPYSVTSAVHLEKTEWEKTTMTEGENEGKDIDEGNPETAPTYSFTNDTNWDNARSQCELFGGNLTCGYYSCFAHITEMLKTIEDENGVAKFWYSGRYCGEVGGPQPNYYVQFKLQEVGNPVCNFIVENPSDPLNIPGLCEIHELDTTTESSPGPVTAPGTITTTTEITTAVTKTTAATKTTAFTKTTVSGSSTVVSTTTSVSSSTFKPICCPETQSRGIIWKEHCSTSIAVMPCPKGATGSAKWFCDLTNGKWTPDNPNLEDCKSTGVADLEGKVDSSKVDEALDLLQNVPPQFGGDVLGIGKHLSEVVNNVETFLEAVEDPKERRDLASNITEKVATVGDNMLSNKQIWNDLPEASRGAAATKLLEDGEKTALQFGYNLNEKELTSVKRSSFSMEVTKDKKGTFVNGLTLPRDTSDRTSFVLPPGFDDSLDSKDRIHTVVAFFKYNDLGDILIKSESSSNFTSSSSLNSPVLSVSVNDPSTSVQFTGAEAKFVVPHRETRADTPFCSFWNDETLAWDTEGCRVVETSSTFTECACNHLTNFAVLMDIHGAVDTLSEDDIRNLKIITQVGCIISIIFLSATIVVTTVYRTLWGMRNSVNRNICISLLIAEILFVAVGDRTESKIFCSIVAGLLHYFFTAAFCWMFLEAVVIYLLLYKVFSPKKSYTKRFYAFGYGVPLLIVTISAASRPSGYGTDKICWLSEEYGFRWSFIGPVCAVLLINIIALIYALRTAVRTNRKVNSRTGPPVATTWILGALTLVPLLGLTWILGLLMMKNEPVLVYSFTALNSLQGAAIFVVQCLVNQSSRKCIIKSLGKYTNLVQVTSMTSTTPRSTTQSDSRKQTSRPLNRCAAKTNASVKDNDSPQGVEQQPTKNRWLFFRSISAQSKSFQLSQADLNGSSDEVRFSASIRNAPGVVLRNTQNKEESL